MARPRRTITKDGYLVCTRCKETKFIEDFYMNNNATWFVLGDTVYGKPQSWCKRCMADHRKESTSAAVVLDVVHEIQYLEDLEATQFEEKYGTPPEGFGSLPPD